MSNSRASLATSLLAIFSSLCAACSHAADWVTQPVNLSPPHLGMDLAFHQTNGTPYLLVRLAGTTQVATRSAPWSWSVTTSHCGFVTSIESRHQDSTIDNLGGIHTVNHDAVGGISVQRTVATNCESEPLENSFEFGTSITTSPTTQLERVLVRRQVIDEPNRISLRLRQRQPGTQWSDQPVQLAAFDVSFDEPNAMTTDANDDWWIASPVHYTAFPAGPQEVRLYHVGQSIALDPYLIQVAFVQDLAMRVAGGVTGPVIALQYAGIQPTNGQIAVFWRGALGWTSADVDSNGSTNVDVAMTATNQQYVAYTKTDPVKGTMVCVASRTAEVGTRPFDVDTVIHAGHVGIGTPLKVALLVDSQDRPVVLTFVSSNNPGEPDRVFESVLIDPTTSVPGVNTAWRRGDGLTVSPCPVRLGGVLSMSVSTPTTRIYVADLAGRLLHSVRTSGATQWDFPATSLFTVPGIYFVIAEGTESGRVVHRLVVTD